MLRLEIGPVFPFLPGAGTNVDSHLTTATRVVDILPMPSPPQ
ncbi:hypothetical protein RSAG8_02407, partial [Rhizoctonia solani AG-8 WAC10335]